MSHHWIAASTVHCIPSKVKIYGSLFTCCDEGTEFNIKVILLILKEL